MQSVTTFQTERYDEYLPCALPLYERHYREICWKPEKFPLDPDHDRYRALEKAGVLRIYTAREDGILVAYALFLVTQHLHYKSIKVGNNDIFFVLPERRGSWLGVKMLKFSRDELKKEGVQAASVRMKKDSSWDAIARRAGFEGVDLTYLNWIGA